MAREFAKSFYNSKQWKQTREYILKRDCYMCVLCGRPAEEVHHKIHLSPANIDNPMISMHENNLISLCGDCHKRLHSSDKTKSGDILPLISFDDDGNPILV